MTRIDGPGTPLRPEGPRRRGPNGPEDSGGPNGRSFRDGLTPGAARRVESATFERMAGPARARQLAGQERDVVFDELVRDEVERAFGPEAPDALMERVVTAFREDPRLLELGDRLLDRIEPSAH